MWAAWLLVACGALLGASVASFANVVVDRVPAGQSVVSPPSACPSCHHQLSPWENIPVLSWLMLGGRCHGCRSPIGVRTVIIEAVGAALGAAAVLLVVVQVLR
jgi:leader peptidase (prepilin peptidase) / N-methyltransferase